jgi:hypothetical protein
MFCSLPRRHIVGFKEYAIMRQKSAVACKQIKNFKNFPVRDIPKSTTEGLKISGSDAKIYHVIIIAAKYYKTRKQNYLYNFKTFLHGRKNATPSVDDCL